MKIKSLKWRCDSNQVWNGATYVEVPNENYWEGFGLGSHYEIRKQKTSWRVWLMGKANISYFKSLEAAKAACQKEFESRILNWIEDEKA